MELADQIQAYVETIAWAILMNLLWALLCFGGGFFHATLMGMRRGDRTLTEFWTWAVGIAVGVYLAGMLFFTLARVAIGSWMASTGAAG